MSLPEDRLTVANSHSLRSLCPKGRDSAADAPPRGRPSSLAPPRRLSRRSDNAGRFGSAPILTSHLALTPGTRLGVYDITAAIGEGGMGQVYRATDAKLKRQVAIKVLPPSLAVDADRLARFQREAEVLASPESSEHRRDLRPRRKRGHDRPRDGTRRR